MSERIDKLEYKEEGGREVTELFCDGPGEFLVKALAEYLKSISPWKDLFGEQITGYQRMDFGIRNFPAIRVYNTIADKRDESWFVEGPVKIDVIFPPSLRRDELQRFQDTVGAAMLQQFRRPGFFAAMREKVPGLNELGRTFGINKELGFEWGDYICPLSQITVNFKIDLREWDMYLASTDRTKDSPFEEVIGTLQRIRTDIDALEKESDETEAVKVEADQDV